VKNDILVGKPKSGMPWKKNSRRAGFNNTSTKRNWEERKEIKKKRQILKEKLDELKEIKIEKFASERKRRDDNSKRKEINEFKSASYQKIRKMEKTKLWSRKAKKLLIKLPPEIFYQKYGAK